MGYEDEVHATPEVNKHLNPGVRTEHLDWTHPSYRAWGWGKDGAEQTGDMFCPLGRPTGTPRPGFLAISMPLWRQGSPRGVQRSTVRLAGGLGSRRPWPAPASASGTSRPHANTGCMRDAGQGCIRATEAPLGPYRCGPRQDWENALVRLMPEPKHGASVHAADGPQPRLHTTM